VAQSSDTSARAVFSLAWPVMISMLSYTAMGLVDTLFVARLGTTALAAVGLAAIVVIFTQSFGRGLLGGVRVLVSQATGANDPHTAATIAWQGFWIALPLGVAISALSLAPDSLFLWLSGDPDVAMTAQEFFTIRVLGAPFVFINITISGWFQGRGDTKTPMRSTLLGNAINIVLDPILIFGLFGLPKMGVSGAALATIISIFISMAYLLKAAAPMFKAINPSPHLHTLKAVVDMGLPIGIRYALDMGSFVVFSAMIAKAGATQLAAHNIVVQIISVSFLPGHAIGESAGVLVGQFVGSKRPWLCRPVITSSIKLAIGSMCAWGLIFMAIPDLLVAPFGPEPAVLAIAVKILLVAAGFQIFDAIVMAISGGINGAGDTKWVMKASLLGAWLIKVPAGYFAVFILDLGAVGAWLGFGVELILLSGFYLYRLKGDDWLKGASEPPPG